MSRPDIAMTDEVQRALKERALQHQAPALPPVPEGCVPYLIAVGESQSEGAAPPAVVAALLRAAADHLDPKHPNMRSQ